MGESVTVRKKPPKLKEDSMRSPGYPTIPAPQPHPNDYEDEDYFMAAIPPRITPMPGYRPSTFESEFERMEKLLAKLDDVFAEFNATKPEIESAQQKLLDSEKFPV